MSRNSGSASSGFCVVSNSKLVCIVVIVETGANVVVVMSAAGDVFTIEVVSFVVAAAT